MLKRGGVILFLVLLAGFVFGLAQLFALRVEDGDVYPPYSSLRADPLGARAYFEGLEEQPRLQTARLYEPMEKMKGGRATTLMLLGTSAFALQYVPDDDVRDLEQFLREGGRVVVSLQPEMFDRGMQPGLWSRRNRAGRQKPEPAKDKKEKKSGEQKADEKKDSAKKDSKKKKQKSPLDDDDEDAPGMAKFKPVSLAEKWGFEFKYGSLPVGENNTTGSIQARRQLESAQLPEQVTWHTAVYFDGLHPDWRTIYSAAGKPVLLERSFGRGSVVLSADSYFVSNEALRKERAAGLLAWLVGPCERVFFDETHLGVNEVPGLAALVRKYRLHGLVLGLIVLAGLFVWKNATSFMPAYEESLVADQEQVAGRDSAAGFVNLLRRNVTPANILNVCLAEWKKSGAHRRAEVRSRVANVEAVIAEENRRAPHQRNPVGAYHAIVRILTERH